MYDPRRRARVARRCSLIAWLPPLTAWLPLVTAWLPPLPGAELLLLIEWFATCFVFFFLAMRLGNIFDDEVRWPPPHGRRVASLDSPCLRLWCCGSER